MWRAVAGFWIDSEGRVDRICRWLGCGVRDKKGRNFPRLLACASGRRTVPFPRKKQMYEGSGVKWRNQSLVLDTESESEILLWHPSEDIEQAAGHTNLESRGAVWARDINLGVIRIKMVI